LALFSVLVNVFGWGQTITSTIVGQVNDPTGAGVPEARVTAKNAETGIATEGATDSSGAYSIPQLQPGIYDITVSKTGFVTHAMTGIRVLSSQTQLLAEQASTAIRPWAISAEPSKGTVSLVRGERE